MTWTLGCVSVILLCRLAAAATVPFLEWEKRFGGKQDESVGSVIGDPAGNIYVGGTTTSTDLPANGAFRQQGDTNLRRVDSSGAIELLRGPFAGGVSAMTVAGGALYVATTAGIMFTRNNGTPWETLPTGPVPTNSITSIAVDPRNPAVVYLAASGLWKTSDGGKTWGRVAGVGDILGRPGLVHSVTIDPRQPAIVYTRNSDGAYRSGDNGASWARLPGKISSVAFDAETPDVVYAGGNDELRISENGGVDWKPLPWPGTSQPEGVIVDPSRPGTIYVRSADTYRRSSDRGQSWKLLPIRAPHLIASADAPVLYAHTEPYAASSLLQSRDGGDTWTMVAQNLFRSVVPSLIAYRGAVFLGGATPQSGFLAKFGSRGELVWSTYVPGRGVSAVTTGPDGSVYFAASCMKPMPWEASPCASDNSTYVGKLSPDGARLLYSREYSTGVSISSIAVDAVGSAHITGAARGRIPTTAGTLWPDAGNIPTPFPNTFFGRIFAAKFSPDAATLTYSTYLGDWAVAAFGFPRGAAPGSIVVERGGHAIVAGPLIWKLGPFGTTLEYSTKIGDQVSGAVLDSSDRLYVVGTGSGEQLYASAGSHLTAATGPFTGFVTKLSPAGEFLESTLLGPASGGRIALGADDSILLSDLNCSGVTRSLIDSAGYEFLVGLDASLSTLRFATPVGGGAQVRAVPLPDGGVAVIHPGAGRESSSESDIVLSAYRWVDSAVRIDAVLNAASAARGPLAPGELVLIRGAGVGEQDVRVRAGDRELQVVRASESELWVVVPNDMELPPARVALTVEGGGQRSQPVGVDFVAAAPALFTVDGSGMGQALALNEDGTLNSAANPAQRGSVLGLAVNGLGKHRMEGVSVVPPRQLSVMFENTYAYGVDSNLVSLPGLPIPVVVVKVFVPPNYPQSPTLTFPSAIRVRMNVEGMGSTPLGPTVWIK